MERKNIIGILITAIVILSVGLIISISGWTKSNAELNSFKNGDGELAQFKDSLVVCDDSDGSIDQLKCVERLNELSSLLSTYEEKLKDIKIPTNQ